MASILPGFGYDIFISYRHNDNRSGWVTDFVNALQEELAATIKEPLTIYFDKSPHDGLLETHNVDKSLEGKLKCLIFIPIISQTYCDPKSFAWQHEFVAFNKLAQEDQIGRDIKLGNGNVSSRILPIKIHELDADDQSVIESEIGGVLRAIQFIYKESGVNRPLNLADNKNDNQNKTDYRNQVNKVANAIKEILYTIKPSQKSVVDKLENAIVNPTKSRRKLGAMVAVVVLVLALAIYFLYPKVMTESGQKQTERSIAVLPFVNMSADPEQEYFSDGISEELINALAKMTNLKVAGRTSSFSFKNKHEDLRKVGESLGVNTILEGSVRKSGNRVRITAQLINVEDGFHLWTQTFDRELSDIFTVQDEITAAIVDEMKVHLGGQQIAATKKMDVAAYTLYLKARQKLAARGFYNMVEARDLFYQSLQLDSSSSLTYSGLSKTLSLLGNWSQGDKNFRKAHEEAFIYSKKALAIDPNNPEAYVANAIAKSWYVWDWKSAEDDIKKAIELNPNDAEINNFAGDYYNIVSDFNKSIIYEARALEIDPLHAVNHHDLALTLLYQGKLEESKKYYRSCLELDKELITIAIIPLTVATFRGDPIINEFESVMNTLDPQKHPAPMFLQMRASIAIGKGELDNAKPFIRELEKLAENDMTSPAVLHMLFYMLGDMEKARYWASRTVSEKDPSLIYQSFKQLPEMYEDEGIRKILTSPELDALFSMRRKNLGMQ